MYWRYQYDSKLEELAEKGRNLFGYKADECITFESLREKIEQNFADIQIESDSSLSDSYLYFEDGKYRFTIRSEKDSFFGELFDLTVLFFYYLRYKNNKEIDGIPPCYVSMDYECSYLAHAFLLPKDKYFDAVIKASAGDSTTVNIDKLCENLWNMNRKVVYLRGKFLEYYH